jgi:ABC-type multidrug transport system ATPase subunit
MEADELSDRVAFINEGKIYTLDAPENLKLKHGKRSVKVRFRGDGEVREEIVELDTADTGERLKDAVGARDLMTIHTEEATLENIFIQMTGRGLEG